MATFILPFYETQRGWYEIEAETIEEARAIAVSDEFTLNDYEPFYKDGTVEWDENDITEKQDGN